MDLTTTRLKVTGMSCGHCADTVQKALRAEPGVRNATVHLDAGAAEVEYEEGRTSPEQLIATVKEAGYDAGMAG